LPCSQVVKRLNHLTGRSLAGNLRCYERGPLRLLWAVNFTPRGESTPPPRAASGQYKQLYSNVQHVQLINRCTHAAKVA
jgi:hypothetical protein